MSGLLHELYNIEDVETVKKVQFGILSPEEIREASVCEVTMPETYDGSEPKFNGLFDPRMGVLDFGRLCPTDENSHELCPGYFGHIELARPVFHYQFIQVVSKLLRCVCFRCSNILVDKTDAAVMKEILKRKGKHRFKYIYDKFATKIRKCKFNDCCYAEQPKKYTRLTGNDIKSTTNIIQIIGDFDEKTLKSSDIKTKQLFTPELCRNIFKNISDEDCELLGFSSKYSRPEWMICTVLPVCPPFVRPSVRQDNNQRAEDDLTHSLITIVKFNNQLRQKIESNADPAVIENYEGCVQLAVATYVDNEIPKLAPMAHRSGRAYKALRKRLKAKEGRIRGNIMGKRCDRSARTVISVDPNISIDQYGVPKKIAMNITYPEIVTKYNMDLMYRLIRNGPQKYPGAKSVVKVEYREDGKPTLHEISLKFCDPYTIVLKEGYIVNRHLQDDDIALFNRQPSLHRMSMMAHRIKVVEHDTFRLNVSVTTPYNADFDGDEMNMHVPKSLQTTVELKELTLVPTQIISPASSKPIIKFVQDTVIGSYLFTNSKNLIDKYQFYNLMMNNPKFNGKLMDAKHTIDGVKYWTGQQVYSTILPDLTVEGRNYKVINGQMEEGRLEKGLMNNVLLQTIHSRYGNKKSKNFLDATQDLITRWMTENSFSIGFGDTLPPKSIRTKIKESTNKVIDKVYDLIKKVYKGEYYPELDVEFRKATFEGEVITTLNHANDTNAKIIVDYLEEKDEDNSILNIVKSGSKGSEINITQMMAQVGQQDIWGKRIEDGFTDRTLPHFPKFDQSPSSRGFIKNSYIEGMTPVENFFHAMAGRNGLIDTAVKTAESGYISRKLIKGLEDLTIGYDYTIRNSRNNIVQSFYGGDGFDPSKIETQKLYLIRYNNIEMEENYKFNNKIKWSKILSKKAANETKKSKDLQKMLDEEFNELIEMRETLRHQIFKELNIIDSVSIRAPFQLKRLIRASIKKFSSGKICDISPMYIIEKIKKLEKDLVKFLRIKDSMIFIKILIRSLLSTKQVIVYKKLNKVTFDYILEQIRYKVWSSLMQPGENVGVLAAQSLGEVSTQMTLNTFHYAGVSSKSVVVTQGVPRLRELLNKSKNISTPSMMIYLDNEYKFDREKTEKLKYDIQYTVMKNIVEKTELIYDLPKMKVESEEDEFISTFDMFNEILGLEEEKSLSKWTLKIIFDKEAMMNRNILMNDVQNAILNNSSDKFITTRFSDDNANLLVLKLKLNDEIGKDLENNIQFFNDIEDKIMNMKLRGIGDGKKNIIKVGMEQTNFVKYHPDGDAENCKEWTLNTDGTNLVDIMRYDHVDTTRTTTNDINEIYEIFGIEGVRSKYIKEFSAIMNDKVEHRHIELLSDVMTSKGIIMQIDRHGINKSNEKGPISKASFEEVNEILTNAAIFSEVDNCNGVSANIMMGQFAKGGTNSFQVLIDEEKIISNLLDDTEIEDEFKEDIKDIEEKIDTEFKIEDEVIDEDFDFGVSLHDNIKKPERKIKKINIIVD